jgi:hypothetical protein
MDGTDVGWIQPRVDDGSSFLGSICITPGMQRKGIGTRVIRSILDAVSSRNSGGYED